MNDPLIGVECNDPFGRIMAGVFVSHALHYEVTIQARFGSAVCALVTQGLGIAIIDEFTFAADQCSRIRALDIVEPTMFPTYVAMHREAIITSHGSRFVEALRRYMKISIPMPGGRGKMTPSYVFCPFWLLTPLRANCKVKALGERPVKSGSSPKPESPQLSAPCHV